ncbi:hypothetical protein ABZ355_41535, partial [Streptomyces sp. NPDC005989]
PTNDTKRSDLAGFRTRILEAPLPAVALETASAQFRYGGSAAADAALGAAAWPHILDALRGTHGPA